MSNLKRTEEIADRLRDQILRGDYQPGDRLPAERELATLLGVNRSSVREALKKLEQMGLVAIRRGDGTTVRHLHEASAEVLRHLLAIDGVVNHNVLNQLMDVQEMMLTGASYLAVERGSDDELNRIRVILRRAAETADPQEFQLLATEAIELVAQAADNLVLRMFRNSVNPSISDGIRALGAHLKMEHEPFIRAVEDVETAIERRDADSASLSVRRLFRLRRDMFLRAISAYEAERDAQRASNGSSPTEEPSGQPAQVAAPRQR